VEIFAGLMAGLAHDLNHSFILYLKSIEGVNNLYKLKKAKKLGRIITE